VLCCFSLA
jgi:hypothetical protein